MVHKGVRVTYMIHKVNSVPNSKLYDIQEIKKCHLYFQINKQPASLG
jgi:hypothetical protein